MWDTEKTYYLKEVGVRELMRFEGEIELKEYIKDRISEGDIDLDGFIIIKGKEVWFDVDKITLREI